MTPNANVESHARFWKKLSIMLTSGVPIQVTLRTLHAEEGDSPLGIAVRKLHAEVCTGIPFIQCIATQRRFFGEEIAVMLESTGGCGNLAEVALTIGERIAQGILVPSQNLRTQPEDSSPDAQGLPPAPGIDDLGENRLGQILGRAVKDNATVIHLEATPAGGRLRFRIDGELRPQEEFSTDQRRELMAQVKLASCLYLDEEKLPQDGKIKIRTRTEDVDIHTHVLPTTYGESAILTVQRVSELRRRIETPEEVFPDDEIRRSVRSACARARGLFLVAGPAKSGKTTTAYATVAQVATPERKIMSVDSYDRPVIPDLQQSQPRPWLGLTTAAVLKSFLRSDPDVVHCGDIRDVETAALLVQIASAGHLTISQLAAPDAIAAVENLLQMGIEPYRLAQTLDGVLAQHLVRRLCSTCKTIDKASQNLPATLVPAGSCAWSAPGCAACSGTGHEGRRVLQEWLEITPGLRRVIARGADRAALLEAAQRDGFRTAIVNGRALVASGEISPAELMRVASE